METRKDKIIRYLNDAWAVEKALVSALPDMAEEANDPNVRALFLEHSQVTHQQEEALEARIRALGGEVQNYKGWFNQFLAKAGDMLNTGHDQYDKTSQNLMQAFATENFEMAMYESLAAYADAVGDTETAQLARQIQAQEKATAERLWPLIAPVSAKAKEVTQL
jgi:ferritin-like metal-binding protein YciE